MVLTIIKNKRGRFDGLETKDKKAAADALSLKTDSVASHFSHWPARRGHARAFAAAACVANAAAAVACIASTL